MATLLAILAIIFYLLSSYRQFQVVSNPALNNRQQVLGFGSIAIVLHIFNWLGPLILDQFITLNFFNVGSLIALVISSVVLLSAIKKPMENLFLGIFPMTALLVLLAQVIPVNTVAQNQWDKGLLSHIILSIMAYSVLTIAAFQAVLLMIQDRQLKHKNMSGMMRALPPLQTMDKLLFEMLAVGTALLTLAIISGMVFLEDIFAQHLIHKTAFTLIAWSIFSFLLFAHWRFGWRGRIASKWTLAGTIFLVLAYFGSKLVLEIILEKV